MSNNKDTLQESILLKRARRRLIGAITILISLLTLSYFFLVDRSEVKKITNVKISFHSISYKKNNFKDLNKVVALKDKELDDLKEFETDHPENNESKPNNNFFIQVGIFSNKKNAKKIAKKVDNIGLETKLLPIILDGQNKIQLVTVSFNDKKKANLALTKIKKAKLPGMIKQQLN